MTYSGDIVVVACGALSSALLMLRSANDDHPHGLANGSGLVGRNYMRHNNSVVMAISRTPNPTKFQKTLGLNDFYFGSDDWDYPLGHIQMVGKSDGVQIRGEGLPDFLQWFPEKPFDWIAQHSLDFWLTSEDLPLPQNRIFYDGERVMLDLTETNMEAHRRLKEKLRDLCGKLDIHPHLFDRSLYLGQNVPIGGTAHQAGTMRFGSRSIAVRARSQLQGPRDRQSLCYGCKFLSLDRSRQSHFDHHCERVARRRPHYRPSQMMRNQFSSNSPSAD